jgi:hypothetical protein
MKKLLLLVGTVLFLGGLGHSQTVQCLASNGAWGPCPFVQPVVVASVGGTAQINNKVSGSAGTTITNAFPGNTTKGNSILCVGFEGIAATPVFTDAQSNTYIVATSSGAAAPGYSVAIATNIVGGTTDTITLTTSSGSASFSCYELQGAVSVGQTWDYTGALHATSASMVFPQQSASIANDFTVVAVGMGAGTINATPSIASVPTVLVGVDQSNTAPLGTSALAVFYSAHANVTNSPTFSQVLSLSASETYSAVMVAVKPFSLSLVGNVQDPCQQATGLYGQINQTANAQIITGSAGKQTYICSDLVVSATAQNIAWVEGTGSTCGTGTAGMSGGATAATGPNLAANGGWAEPGGGFAMMATATAGDNICIFQSSTGQVSGHFRYVQQ